MLVAPTAGQEPTLEQVLARASGYVTNLHKQLSGIVAEETYLQRSVLVRNTIGFSAISHRRLKSDLLLVRLAGADDYVEFRDVFEVDGTAVRDREERLTKLFLQPAADLRAQLRQIADEGARYNLGRVFRSINTPLLALAFLEPRRQTSVEFRRVKHHQPRVPDNPAGADLTSDAFTVAADAWTIAFKEKGRPTFIRTLEGGNFPAAGKLWVDPMTGTVLVSELVMDGHRLSGTIVVSFQSEPLLGFRVPVAMDERHRTDRETIMGRAMYGRFRQFHVKTTEVLGKPPGQ